MAQDVYLFRYSASLGAGASITVAHGLVANGAAAAPNVVMPDRNTPIYVAATTTTTITFTNPTAAPLVAIFFVQFVHSINATAAQVGAGLLWKGGSAGAGATSPFMPTNEFFIDTTAVADASMRIYPSMATAAAAAEADAAIVASGADFQLREGQNHAWVAGAGLAVASTMEVCIFGVNRDNTTIDLSGVFPAGGAGAALRCYNTTVTQAGALATGAGRSVTFSNCLVNHGGNTLTTGIGGVIAFDSMVTNPRYIGVGLLGIIATRCSFSSGVGDLLPILFNTAAIYTFQSCQFDLAETNMAALLKDAGAGAAVGLFDCAIKQNNAGAGAALLFDVGATPGTIQGTTLSVRSSGGGTTAFGMTGGTGAGTGLIVTPAQGVATITGLPVTATVLNGARVFATSVAGQVIVDGAAAAIVVFGTQVQDTAVAYDPGTGIFTAPYAGTYRVSACVRFAAQPAAAVVTMEIFGGAGAGATIVKTAKNIIITGSGSVGISADVALGLGDTMTIRVSDTNGGGNVALTAVAEENYLTITYAP